MVPPDSLINLNEDATLEDVSITITNNYSIYHITANRLIALQEWVKRIREESTDVDGRTKGN